MKLTATLAAASLFAASVVYAQGNFDLNYRQNIYLKKSQWNLDKKDDTNNIRIELTNKSQRDIKNITFEIVANDAKGTRLKFDSGYSKKLSSTKVVPASDTGTYTFVNIFASGTPPQDVQISNVHIDYEDGSVENIRLDIK